MITKELAVAAALSVLATVAHGQTSFVGKKASVVSALGAVPSVLPAFPATVTISVGVPEKYKSKKDLLLISTSAQENCTGDSVYSTVKVGGFQAEPDPTGFFFAECQNGSGFEERAREWFLVPESGGGPVVPPGATVDWLLSSGAGTSVAAAAAMHVELQK